MIITILLFIFLFMGIDLLLGVFLIPQNFNEFRIRNSWYHHGLKKNVDTHAVWGPLIYSFVTNNLSFRDAEKRNIPLNSNNKRILILGDSHSEGVGIEYNFTFPGRLQKMAAQKSIEILNASAVSYSPKIHYLKADYLLNKLGLTVDEIWVVVDISDLQNEIAYRSFKSTDQKWIKLTGNIIKRFLLENSFTSFSFNAIKEKKKTDILKKVLLGFKQDKGNLPQKNSIELYKEFFRSFENEDLLRNPDFHGVSEWIYNSRLRELADEGLELGFENILKLKQLCNQKGIKLRLSVHPWQTQVLKGDTTDYYVERWRNFCHSENIGFINLYPVFINEENPLWVAKTCYIEGDNHFNETGHERVADYLKKYLDE